MKTLLKTPSKHNRNIVKEFIRVYLMVLMCGIVASAITGCALVINSEDVRLAVTQERILTTDNTSASTEAVTTTK